MSNNFFYLLFFARNIEIIWGREITANKEISTFSLTREQKEGPKKLSEINQNTLGDHSVY